MEDEINLREYIDVLLRQWKMIVSITLTAVVVVGLVSFFSPRTYEAKAGMLVIHPDSGILSQRQTLIAMLKSNTVTTQVIEQLGDKLVPKERIPENILDKVRVGGQDNIIEILVRHTDPQTAAAIANAWAKPYESYINSLYVGIAQSPRGLQALADAAKKEYKEEQKALEDFISSNRVDELSRQIAGMEMLYDIKSLREQIKAGSSSSASATANVLALILLQTKAFTSLPAELQVSLDKMSALNASLDDMDALISTLEERSGVTKGQSISELRQEILQLRGELEQEKAKLRELESSRDIVWQVYTTIARKVVDTKIAAPVQSYTVQVIQDAVVPQSPVSQRRGMNVGIALVLGLALGVFSAFGIEYFKKTGAKPELKKDEG